ncbi:hypothetical protein C7974DRAFT_199193 [Boeremia exigua]|uniref:uncharacterized protein n=1 Tax=Boeremia exigua TaxID=749465 RepID=UPI001E8ED47E|nr:uncharacterized protein C7974DRAFT_199193 [Boeremia exigua]KAH6625343.1 hypothetical protein C7974DRAFT_199193 [Boeremia exigua]
MKLLYHALLLLLAVVAFAHDPTHQDSTLNSTQPQIGPSDVVYRYADLMNGPEPESRYANPFRPAVGEDDKGRLLASYQNVPVIRMSTVKQHVGEFAGQRLFNIIHDALLKICPYERGRIGCYPNMPGAGRPQDDNTLKQPYKYYDRFWILDVPYINDKGDYATNAWITITAQAIFRDQKYPGIAAATYEMAAGVFARVTEIERFNTLLNCYIEEFNKDSRPYTFCNVPEHVLVALPANDDRVTESWLSVTVKFNGMTAFGNYDCYDNIGGVKNFWDDTVLPNVVKSMGQTMDDWGTTCVECWNEKERFDVETWRHHHTCDWLGWPMNG